MTMVKYKYKNLFKQDKHNGQAIIEYTFCMIIIFLMLFGSVMVLRWVGATHANRRISHEKNLKQAFEPFSRFEPGSTSTGLGLSIVHKIVTIHGGTIEIGSPGRKKGTTVTILLPKT